MENLLPDITVDILSRLPFESVLHCKLVSKTWLALLKHPSFTHMHLCRSLQLDDDDHKYSRHASSASASKVGFIFLTRLPLSLGWKGPWFHDEIDYQVKKVKRIGLREKNGLLYYGDYDGNDEQSYTAIRRINHHPVRNSDIVGSCNGLICLSIESPEYNVADPSYICNPITREYVNLPSLETVHNGEKFGRMVRGFGYHPSTNKYKVVRIYYHLDQDCGIGHVWVYTIGGGNGSESGTSRWKNIGEITYAFRPIPPGIFANGAVHWVDVNWKIVAFDLADEEFRVLPSPPCLFSGESGLFYLCVLGERLCIVHKKKEGGCLDIWSLKKKKGCCYYDIKEQEYESCSWSKDHSITWECMHPKDEYHPFAITKNGEVLLWFNERILARYDPKTASVENLVDHGRGVTSPIGAFIHMNSFVSLKSLGEDSEIIGSYEDSEIIGSYEDEESESD